MVFNGKPSLACGRCRLRRLKCDQGTPFCSACLRGRADCCEYRDALSLNFRDENTKAMRKSLQLTSKTKATPPAIAVLAPLSQELAWPAWQLARGYMYTNYMTGFPHGGYLPCLINLTEQWPDSPLQAAITAVGLAALGNIRSSPELLLEAHRECITAVSSTSKAISDPVAAKRDDVLAAVVMLSMFEVITCSDSASMCRWMAHMDGATRIIEVRGDNQFQRTEGVELFRHLRVGICLSSIYQERQTSSMFTYLTERVKHCGMSEAHNVDDLARVVLRLNNFVAMIRHMASPSTTEIVKGALKLDADLLASLMDVPTALSYDLVDGIGLSTGSLSDQHVLGGRYHVYNSISACSMWNNYRSARILIREIILDTLQTAKYEGHAPLHAIANESRRLGIELVADICASVPSYLDPGLCNPRPTKSSAAAKPGGTGGCITLLWPLLLAANSGFASKNQRDWILGRLDRIGRDMGIGQARAMAQLLRDGRKTRSWVTTGEMMAEEC